MAVLAALLGLEGLRRDDAFGAWLVGIGLNRCRRALREGAGRRSTEGLSEAPASGVEPVELIGAAEVARRVCDAIAGLPAGQREAIVLFYLAGLTQSEVAEHLGTPVGAVKTRLHKARESLRVELTDVWKEHFTMADATAPPIPVKVADVRLTDGAGSALNRHVVLLEEVDGDRQVAIWIGEPEGTALALALERVAAPRPGTYVQAAGLLEAAGARLSEVRISRLVD